MSSRARIPEDGVGCIYATGSFAVAMVANDLECVGRRTGDVADTAMRTSDHVCPSINCLYD